MAYKIVLDAGHGGEDPGAVYKDRKEKDDNLKLTLAVGKILEENGVDVVYTRTTDIYQTPFEKAKAANEAGADFLFLFIATAVLSRNNTMELKYWSMIRKALNIRWHRISWEHWENWGFGNWA